MELASDWWASTVEKPKPMCTLDSLLEEFNTKLDVPLAFCPDVDFDDSVIKEGDAEVLTEDQKRTLSKFVQAATHIQATHPGQVVLDDERYGCLFLESLSPAVCGVKDINPVLCSFLTSQYQPELLSDLLSSDILSMIFSSLVCKEKIQKWLFYIMSVHSNCLVVKKCEEQLLFMLQQQLDDNYQSTAFAPTVSNIVCVFVNWGVAEIKFDYGIDLEDEILFQTTQQNNTGQQHQVTLKTVCRNIIPVLTMLSQWLQAKPKYSVAELRHILLMICQLCLDPTASKASNIFELQTVVGSILSCFNEDELVGTLPLLCQQLSNLSGHHHDRVYLCSLFTSPQPMSLMLQKRLAYYLLHTTVLKDIPSNKLLSEFEILDLVPIMHELRNGLKDMYQLSSLLVFLSMSVGAVGHDEKQRKQLALLLREARSLLSILRDSVKFMDNTTVKGRLMQICLNWEVAVKAVHLRQTTLFNNIDFAPQYVPIELLEDHGSLLQDELSPVCTQAIAGLQLEDD